MWGVRGRSAAAGTAARKSKDAPLAKRPISKDLAKLVRLTLDAEMQRMTGGLQVLALTDSLQAGDFARFRPIAMGFLDQYGRGGTILVADRDGHQVFSSNTTDTKRLSPRNTREIVDRGFQTQQPQ